MRKKLNEAIQNITDDHNGVVGTYWRYVGGSEQSFTQNKLYESVRTINWPHALIDDSSTHNGWSRNNHEYFVKATRKELEEHFNTTVKTFGSSKLEFIWLR